MPKINFKEPQIINSEYSLHLYAQGLRDKNGFCVELGYGFTIGNSNRLYPVFYFFKTRSSDISYLNEHPVQYHMLNGQHIISAKYSTFLDLVKDYPEFALTRDMLNTKLREHDIIGANAADEQFVIPCKEPSILRGLSLKEITELTTVALC